jgi:hypothetical protein
MPFDTVVLSAVIVLVFALFSVTLLWAEAQSRRARREEAARERRPAAPEAAHVQAHRRAA